jgi:hypothetical protein
VNQTWRGVLIFAGVLVTIALWVPLSNQAQRTASGSVITDTFFGVFRYATLKTELKEPDYTMAMSWNWVRLVITIGITFAFWSVIAAVLGRTRQFSPPDRANPQ